MGLTKRELIDMFKNKIFPSQARHLKNVNYEGKGEVDEQEYLRDTAIIIDLAEKGLDYEARLKADMEAMLKDLRQDFIAEAYGIEMDCTDYVVNVADIDKVIQQKINSLKKNQKGK